MAQTDTLCRSPASESSNSPRTSWGEPGWCSRSRRRGDKIEPALQARARVALALRRRLLRLFQSQQAQPGRRSQGASRRALVHRWRARRRVIENYAPGTMERLGCGYETLAVINPRLIMRAQGFLSGPYEHRPALDEWCSSWRARLYDRAAGPAAARRHFGGRHHGRRLRRHRHLAALRNATPPARGNW